MIKRLFVFSFLILMTSTASAQEYTSNRPAEPDRLFKSDAVEAKINEVVTMLTNPRLAWMFMNCFPNT